MYVWGAQVEAGVNSPTSHIITGAASASRATDDFDITSVRGEFNNSQGSFLFEFMMQSVPFASLGGGYVTGNGRLVSLQNSSGAISCFDGANSGPSLTQAVNGVFTKAGLAYGQGIGALQQRMFTSVITGTFRGTGTFSGTFGTNPATSFTVGGDSFNASEKIWVKRAEYWAYAIPDALMLAKVLSPSVA